MGHIVGTPFGIGSPVINPLLQVSAASPLQAILQSLQAVTHQLQQLQQLDYLQQQQLQQLQQLIQIVPQQIQQLQQAGLTGFAAPPFGVPAYPFQTQSPFLAGQPGQVM